MQEHTPRTVGQPEAHDALTELVRQGAVDIIARAVRAEVDAFLSRAVYF